MAEKKTPQMIALQDRGLRGTKRQGEFLRLLQDAGKGNNGVIIEEVAQQAGYLNSSSSTYEYRLLANAGFAVPPLRVTVKMERAKRNGLHFIRIYGSRKKAAEKLGVSDGTLGRIRRAKGQTTPHRTHEQSLALTEQIVNILMSSDGHLSNATIGTMLSVSRYVVKTYRHRAEEIVRDKLTEIDRNARRRAQERYVEQSSKPLPILKHKRLNDTDLEEVDGNARQRAREKASHWQVPTEPFSMYPPSEDTSLKSTRAHHRDTSSRRWYTE